jgi:DDB1- and CUL4-associated factor 11
MSAPQTPGQNSDPRTIVYDPNDPFWRDDDDDIDYDPQAGHGDEDEEDSADELDFPFHGRSHMRYS